MISSYPITSVTTLFLNKITLWDPRKNVNFGQSASGISLGFHALVSISTQNSTVLIPQMYNKSYLLEQFPFLCSFFQNNIFYLSFFKWNLESVHLSSQKSYCHFDETVVNLYITWKKSILSFIFSPTYRHSISPISLSFSPSRYCICFPYLILGIMSFIEIVNGILKLIMPWILLTKSSNAQYVSLYTEP